RGLDERFVLKLFRPGPGVRSELVRPEARLQSSHAFVFPGALPLAVTARVSVGVEAIMPVWSQHENGVIVDSAIVLQWHAHGVPVVAANTNHGDRLIDSRAVQDVPRNKRGLLWLRAGYHPNTFLTAKVTTPVATAPKSAPMAATN